MAGHVILPLLSDPHIQRISSERGWMMRISPSRDGMGLGENEKYRPLSDESLILCHCELRVAARRSPWIGASMHHALTQEGLNPRGCMTFLRKIASTNSLAEASLHPSIARPCSRSDALPFPARRVLERGRTLQQGVADDMPFCRDAVPRWGGRTLDSSGLCGETLGTVADQPLRIADTSAHQIGIKG